MLMEALSEEPSAFGALLPAHEKKSPRPQSLQEHSKRATVVGPYSTNPQTSGLKISAESARLLRSVGGPRGLQTGSAFKGLQTGSALRGLQTGSARGGSAVRAVPGSAYAQQVTSEPDEKMGPTGSIFELLMRGPEQAAETIQIGSSRRSSIQSQHYKMSQNMSHSVGKTFARTDPPEEMPDSLSDDLPPQYVELIRKVVNKYANPDIRTLVMQDVMEEIEMHKRMGFAPSDDFDPQTASFDRAKYELLNQSVKADRAKSKYKTTKTVSFLAKSMSKLAKVAGVESLELDILPSIIETKIKNGSFDSNVDDISKMLGSAGMDTPTFNIFTEFVTALYDAQEIAAQTRKEREETRMKAASKENLESIQRFRARATASKAASAATSAAAAVSASVSDEDEDLDHGSPRKSSLWSEYRVGERERSPRRSIPDLPKSSFPM